MNKSKKTIICIAIAVVVIICAVILKNTVFAPKGAFKEGSSGVIEYSGYNVEGGWSRSQGFGCSPIKAARELGSERREKVWSLSSALVGILRRPAHSTRGPGWTDLWYAGCRASGTAGWLRSGGITAESI